MKRLMEDWSEAPFCNSAVDVLEKFHHKNSQSDLNLIFSRELREVHGLFLRCHLAGSHLVFLIFVTRF